MAALAEERGVRLLLPIDVRVSKSLDIPLEMEVTDLTQRCCTLDKPCIPAGEGRGPLTSMEAHAISSVGNFRGPTMHSDAWASRVVHLGPQRSGLITLTRDTPFKVSWPLPSGRYGIDIGPQSEAAFATALAGCKTIFLNGPMGKFEVGCNARSVGAGVGHGSREQGHCAQVRAKSTKSDTFHSPLIGIYAISEVSQNIHNGIRAFSLFSMQVPEFASGTHSIIRAIAAATANGAITVIGGGAANVRMGGCT